MEQSQIDKTQNLIRRGEMFAELVKELGVLNKCLSDARIIMEDPKLRAMTLEILKPSDELLVKAKALL